MGAPPGNDDGYTLIEVLIAVLLVAVGVTAVLGALQVGISSSALQRDLSDGQVALRAFAEHVKDEDYQPCSDGPTAYGTGFTLDEARFAATVESVGYWDGTVSSERPFMEEDDVDFDDCVDPGDDPGMQLIKLQVEIIGFQGSPAGSLGTDVVKRAGG